MANMGRLTTDRFGFSMPVDAPLYPKPPIVYKNVDAIQITYETEEEAALDSLPQGLELISPATVIIFIVRYGFSTIGPYNEAIQMLLCQFEDRMGVYVSKILLDSAVGMAAGREIWGFPKKLASIEFSNKGEAVVGTVERPAGNRLCTATMKLEAPVDPSQLPALPLFNLRVIPHPEEGHPPSLVQLIEVIAPFTYSEVWQGPGSLQFDTVSPVDLWHKLPVKQVNTAHYIHNSEFQLPFGRVIKTY